MDNKNTEFVIREIKDSNSLELNNHIFKIVIVGDSGVGKSNILSRYVQDEFYQESKSTVGVELSTKNYKINDSFVKVNIWDTAGQERYKSITAAYYKGAKGAMIVFDLTRKDTYESVDKWFNDIKSMADNNIMVLLVANKCDLDLLRQVELTKIQEKAKALSVPFIETSALKSSNIEEAFKKIILEIYLQTVNSKINNTPQSKQKITLGNTIKIDNEYGENPEIKAKKDCQC